MQNNKKKHYQYTLKLFSFIFLSNLSVNLELSIYSLIIYKIKLHIMIAYSVSN